MYDECDGFNAGETLNRTEVNVLEYDECDECDECDGFNAGGSATLTRVILIVITNRGVTLESDLEISLPHHLYRSRTWIHKSDLRNTII